MSALDENETKTLPTDSPPRPIAYIAGPTAVGKSAVALRWAELEGWEILSLDSRQVYRQLELGTAKPSAGEQERVRHHLVDCLNLNEACSAGSFRELYEVALRDIADRAGTAVAVGGTGFYWEVCARGLHELPPASPELRTELVERDSLVGLEGLYFDLTQLDPIGAAQVPRGNRHRVMRAIELVRTTGKPLAEIYAGRRSGPEAEPVPVFYLTRPRDRIYARIEARCKTMIAAGLLEEIRGLLAEGWPETAPGLQTVGYREFFAHLRGEESLANAVEKFLVSTRRYAKRQETWFRNRVPERIEVSLGDDETADEVIARLRRHLEAGPR